MWKHQIAIANGQMALQSRVLGVAEPVNVASGTEVAGRSRSKKTKVKKIKIKSFGTFFAENIASVIGHLKKNWWVILLAIMLMAGYFTNQKFNWLVKLRSATPASVEQNTVQPTNQPESKDLGVADNVNGVTGVDLSFGTGEVATTASSTETVAVPEPVESKYIVINPTPTGWLNVRATASRQAKILTQVNAGDKFQTTNTQQATGEEYRWYEIVLTDGTRGWVFGQYVAEIEG